VLHRTPASPRPGQPATSLPSENDWHLHSKQEGCDPTYEAQPQLRFELRAGGERPTAGFRSLHMGPSPETRRTPCSTRTACVRRQPSSWTRLEPGKSLSQLDFWHIIDVCERQVQQRWFPANTFAGRPDPDSACSTAERGKFEQWQEALPDPKRLQLASDRTSSSSASFDPGGRPEPAEERDHLRDPAAVVPDMGNIYGPRTETCTIDTDNNDSHQQGLAGSTTKQDRRSRTLQLDQRPELRLVPGETGPKGRGVVGQGSSFKPVVPLQGTPGQGCVGWIEMGGGWNFGESEVVPRAGGPASLRPQYFAFDDGWYVDDIRLTDLRTSPAVDHS